MKLKIKFENSIEAKEFKSYSKHDKIASLISGVAETADSDYDVPLHETIAIAANWSKFMEQMLRETLKTAKSKEIIIPSKDIHEPK